MFIVETTRRRFLLEEFRSWTLLLVIMVLVILIGVHLLHRPFSNMIAANAGLVFAKLGTFLVRHIVRRIEIDPDAELIRFHLKSIMSGSSEKSFPLQQLESSFKHRPKWLSLFVPATVLKISDSQKQVFRITPRYGFSSADLESVHDMLESF